MSVWGRQWGESTLCEVQYNLALWFYYHAVTWPASLTDGTHFLYFTFPWTPCFSPRLSFTPLQKARKTTFTAARQGEMLPLLSLWKIKQVLARHPVVNGYVVDLFDSKTDSMTALRSLLSSLRKTSPCFICSMLHSTQPCSLGLVSPLPHHTL